MSKQSSHQQKENDYVFCIPDSLLLVQDWEFIDVWQGTAFGNWTGLALDDLVRQLEFQWTQNISWAILLVAEFGQNRVNDNEKKKKCLRS